MTPSQFFALSRPERAFIIAAIQVRTERDAQRRQELESKSKHHK